MKNAVRASRVRGFPWCGATVLVASLLAGCGGGDAEHGAAEAARTAQPQGVLPAVSDPVALLFDDEGEVMPSAPAAVPAQADARTRSARYATHSQAAQLVSALGATALVVDMPPGRDPQSLLDTVVPGVLEQRAARALSLDAPVLVRGPEPPLAAAAVDRIERAGFSRVFLVTP